MLRSCGVGLLNCVLTFRLLSSKNHVLGFVMNEVVMLIGNIGTGKSTIARVLQKEEAYVIISADGMRYSIGGGNYLFNPKYESTIWRIVGFALNGFMELGINIIIDATNLSLYARKKNLDIIKKYENYKVIGFVMPDLDMAAAVNRRMQDPHDSPDKNMWEGAWKRLNSTYEKPTKGEGFDEIIFLDEEMELLPLGYVG